MRDKMQKPGDGEQDISALRNTKNIYKISKGH